MFARYLNGLFESGNAHVCKAITHPGSCIEQLEFIGGCGLDIPHVVGEPLKKVVVIENKLSIQSSSDVDLDDVATHARGERERLQGVLGHVAVRGAVADELHLATTQNSGMSRRDGGHEKREEKTREMS